MQFLPQALHARTLAFACAHQDRFTPAKAGREVRPSYRQARVVYSRELGAVRSGFLARLEALLPDIFPRLQLVPFRPHDIDIQLTAHLDGDFFAQHQDNTDEATRARRISYVYYFQRTPRCFTGGDLLLFDTDLPANISATACTRIAPVDNSLILFPSDYFHEVTPVSCASDDFADGRFTLNGWMRATPSVAGRGSSLFRG